jgi:AraC-like DNA-binding protein
MKLCDLNPHIRFAARIHYISECSTVKVSDCRIFYVDDGEAKLTIAGQCYSLLPHSLFYCCGGSEYTIEAPEGFDPICLNFDLTQARNEVLIPYPTYTTNWDSMQIHFDEIADSPLLSGHFYLENAKELLPVITKIMEYFSGKAPFFRELSSCTLKKLLLLLHRDPQIAIPPKMALVKSYIDQHYADDITNKDLAALAGYHEYHLNRIFLAATGINLHEYLLQARLNQASYLILNTDLPLKSIPEQTGFHSYPHFSSYFKQHFGLSPAQYRKQVRDGI